MIPDRVFFRVDAGLRIGSGHVMRCLTLATALKKKGIDIVFLSRPHEGNLISLVREKGFDVVELSPPLHAASSSNEYGQWLGGSASADAKEVLEAIEQSSGAVWLVTDHYGIDESWESLLRKEVGRIITLDDLANRKHDCDILIDSSFQRDGDHYFELVPKHAHVLTGTTYCLLRSEFSEARRLGRHRVARLPPARILVSLGGVDVQNMTGKVIKELEHSSLPDTTHIDVVIGPASPHAEVLQLQAIKSRLDVSVKQGVDNMAERILVADLCVGAVGSSVWERLCLGCPSIVAKLAPNQFEGAKRLELAGVVESFAPVVAGQLRDIIDGLSAKKLKQLSDNGFSLVDGLGADRIVKILLE
jgi:UDP-2,4-diacetamido-2,4,6-trideoxy-beta-L-altropyranose hydrolase